MNDRLTRSLLNLGHALDHMFLLIFATAVTSIATEFGFQKWEDLMPYSVAAFFFFGVGSLPAGKLGDQWGRRSMMIIFFIGIGAAAIGVSLAQSTIQLAVALALLGAFASIYHPVGIPLLVQGSERPGWTIGINGLCGNMGVALAAVITGFLVKFFGWRTAFVVPGLVSIACGALFALYASRESAPPAKRKSAASSVPAASIARLLFIMTLAATTSSLLFNFSTSSNFELLSDRFVAISKDPARIGLLLGVVYAVASLAQLVVGRMIDKYPLKPVYLWIVAAQALCLALATQLSGWAFYAIQFVFMATIFGAVPFTDAMLVRFVDDTIRSRVAGMRLAVSIGASSLAIFLIGPLVKQAGFTALLWVMAFTSVATFAVILNLPSMKRS